MQSHCTFNDFGLTRIDMLDNFIDMLDNFISLSLSGFLTAANGISVTMCSRCIFDSLRVCNFLLHLKNMQNVVWLDKPVS